jgi:hypothetical protein
MCNRYTIRGNARDVSIATGTAAPVIRAHGNDMLSIIRVGRRDESRSHDFWNIGPR